MTLLHETGVDTKIDMSPLLPIYHYRSTTQLKMLDSKTIPPSCFIVNFKINCEVLIKYVEICRFDIMLTRRVPVQRAVERDEIPYP